jgi:hypothetical protein
MKVAFGLKAHSGWAALVVVGRQADDLVVVDRRRIELVEEAWAKQPYHAAEKLAPAVARRLVDRGIEAARRIAVREMRAAVSREQERKNDVIGCAVLLGAPMPDWTVDEILAVHFRMHKAEGVLFRDALVRAATECDVTVAPVAEKEVTKEAQRALGSPARAIAKVVATLGKSVGPPWGQDQKQSALAALIALARVKRSGRRHLA